MIQVYYDPTKKNWYHQLQSQKFTWGKEKKVISYFGGNVKTMLPFSISENSGRLSPIVGILAGNSKTKTTFSGNAATFIRIQKELEKQGSLCVVFTPSSVGASEVNGFYYLRKVKKWVRIKTPLPDIVYNRIPYRKMEKDFDYSQLLTLLEQKNIPYFNPSFFSKWSVYQSLRQNPKIQSYLPDTTLYSLDSLIMMIEKYKCVYLKSDQGHKGKGLFRIRKHNHGFSLASLDQQLHFNSLIELDNYLGPFLEKDKYLVQESIVSDTFESKRYDIRILVHLSHDNHYRISGTGIRLSGKNDLTTHVPNGGKIISLSIVEDRINEKLLSNIVEEIGHQLSKDLKASIGEFSVDIGKTPKNDYYIFEVNSKPMVFDEPHIRNDGLANLIAFLITQAKDYQN
ncbi:YheC/YheD family endospore coat-associated protein [Litchfieldia salsa]|uniref:YheC/D like ATP-grasp n=1 Tax=Litchfieldia salsa TaxID=930152 RepID=A0A1H0UX14_9BACI|nr:YheC/YheD family protein [Litchfieldia salsa]SDP70727.1 YheC/D like ATP-grasp [Litchfieldia salsa]